MLILTELKLVVAVLKCYSETKGSASNTNARNVSVYHCVKIRNYISKFSQDISLSDNKNLNSYLDI